MSVHVFPCASGFETDALRVGIYPETSEVVFRIAHSGRSSDPRIILNFADIPKLVGVLPDAISAAPQTAGPDFAAFGREVAKLIRSEGSEDSNILGLYDTLAARALGLED